MRDGDNASSSENSVHSAHTTSISSPHNHDFKFPGALVYSPKLIGAQSHSANGVKQYVSRKLKQMKKSNFCSKEARSANLKSDEDQENNNQE